MNDTAARNGFSLDNRRHFAEVVELQNRFPTMAVDFYRFVESAAYRDGESQPVTFSVVNRPTKQSRQLHYTLTWTDRNGQRQTVRDCHFHELMLQAVIVDAAAWEEYKRGLKGGPRPNDGQMGLF